MIKLTEQLVIATYETADYKTVEDWFTIFSINNEKTEAIFDSSYYDVSNIELIEIVDVIREQEVYIKLGDVENFIKNSLLGF
jgi:hypothetical protein